MTTERGRTARNAPTARDVFRLAWPIVLANSAVPLLGLVDTAVIGNTGRVQDLGAIALGALVFSFVYWSFGFLRMGTTGFTAQASGAGDHAEVRATLARALLLAGSIAIALVALQHPIVLAALALLGASAEVESLTRAYFEIRIWGAPATLGTYAVLGSFVGLGRTRHVLVTQLLLNGLNIVLDVAFAWGLGWGVRGIALGTALAEWTTFLIALWMLRRLLLDAHVDREAFWPWPRIFDREKVAHTLSANADILVRTLFLLLGFAWFTNEGAQFGDTILAANHILLQLIAMSAYLLDGYAHATEVLVGRAVGTRSRTTFDGAVASATRLAGSTAVGLGVIVWLGGPYAVGLLTDLPPVRASAAAFLPHTAVYVVVSFAAFQLDGIFIGATRTRDMRNASVASFTVFLFASLWAVPRAGNAGLWSAFVLYVVVRAAALGVFYPRLRAEIVDPAG